MKNIPIILTCLVFPFLANSLISQQPTENLVKAPKLLQTNLRANVPISIAQLHIPNPQASYLIRIGPEGNMLDGICLESSHPELNQRGLTLLKQARYEPGSKDGQPVTADLGIVVQFSRPEQEIAGSVSQSGIDHIESMLKGMKVDDYAFNRSTPRELDSPPQILSQGQTTVPVNDAGDPINGKALIQVYVNELGEPCMPEVLDSESPVITNAALATLKTWKFTPPTRNGKPTYYRMNVPFEFGG